jgi:hypothetical protein
MTYSGAARGNIALSLYRVGDVMTVLFSRSYFQRILWITAPFPIYKFCATVRAHPTSQYGDISLKAEIDGTDFTRLICSFSIILHDWIWITYRIFSSVVVQESDSLL